MYLLNLMYPVDPWINLGATVIYSGRKYLREKFQYIKLSIFSQKLLYQKLKSISEPFLFTKIMKNSYLYQFTYSMRHDLLEQCLTPQYWVKQAWAVSYWVVSRIRIKKTSTYSKSLFIWVNMVCTISKIKINFSPPFFPDHWWHSWASWRNRWKSHPGRN